MKWHRPSRGAPQNADRVMGLGFANEIEWPPSSRWSGRAQMTGALLPSAIVLPTTYAVPTRTMRRHLRSGAPTSWHLTYIITQGGAYHHHQPSRTASLGRWAAEHHTGMCEMGLTIPTLVNKYPCAKRECQSHFHRHFHCCLLYHVCQSTYIQYAQYGTCRSTDSVALWIQ